VLGGLLRRLAALHALHRGGAAAGGEEEEEAQGADAARWRRVVEEALSAEDEGAAEEY
jgi:hypothetical protein